MLCKSRMFLLLAATFLAGCQRSTDVVREDEGTSAETDTRGSGTSSSKRKAALASESPRITRLKKSGPEAIINEFLKAARDGDEAIAMELLTTKARQATDREGLVVNPPGTPTMQFTVGEIEYPTDTPDAAYVHSLLTDDSFSGQESTRVTWIMRKETAGWRIAGMATQFTEDEPPLFLNFEEPADLARIKQEVASDENPLETQSATRPASHLEYESNEKR